MAEKVMGDRLHEGRKAARRQAEISRCEMGQPVGRTGPVRRDCDITFTAERAAPPYRGLPWSLYILVFLCAEAVREMFSLHERS